MYGHGWSELEPFEFRPLLPLGSQDWSSQSETIPLWIALFSNNECLLCFGGLG